MENILEATTEEQLEYLDKVDKDIILPYSVFTMSAYGTDETDETHRAIYLKHNDFVTPLIMSKVPEVQEKAMNVVLNKFEYFIRPDLVLHILNKYDSDSTVGTLSRNVYDIIQKSMLNVGNVKAFITYMNDMIGDMVEEINENKNEDENNELANKIRNKLRNFERSVFSKYRSLGDVRFRSWYVLKDYFRYITNSDSKKLIVVDIFGLPTLIEIQNFDFNDDNNFTEESFEGYNTILKYVRKSQRKLGMRVIPVITESKDFFLEIIRKLSIDDSYGLTESIRGWLERNVK